MTGYNLLNIILQTQQKTGSETDTSFLGWFLAFMIAMAVIFVVGQPLLQLETGKKRTRVRQVSDAQLELETLRERAAAEKLSLEELEFDRELGIIETTDYNLLNERSRNRLNTLEKAISERTEEIAEGEREVRRKNRQAPVAEPAVRKQAMTSADKPTGEIKVKNQTRESLKCSECGAPYKRGEKFCASCKAPLSLICANCGTELKDENAKFCSRCGMAMGIPSQSGEEANS